MPSILTEIGQKPEKTPPLTVGISKYKRGIFGFLFRIDGINGRMGLKISESGSLRGQNLSIGSLRGHPKKSMVVWGLKYIYPRKIIKKLL
jgi:hypothetical protein